MEQKTEDSSNYMTWAYITGVLVFIGVWLYSLSEWGFLIGLMFGWIPALIAGFVGGLLWPLVALVVVLIILMILQG